MDKDWPEPKDKYSRLDTDLSEKDPADRDDEELNDIERRDTLTDIVESEEPSEEPSREVQRNEAVYGDTALNPNEDDVRDEHEASPDEVV